jgi:hypothetical protein
MDARYPIGKFDKLAAPDREDSIAAIESLPSDLKAAVSALPLGGLDKPYREGGWTGRQVVHHLADSHMNCQLRFRFALTEDKPTIKPYDEGAWAKLVDAETGDIAASMTMIEGMHGRWTKLLRSMTEEQWQRTLLHPETGEWDLERLLGFYAWHGRHHVAHLGLIR